jgi:hypothetical protein
VFQGRCHDDSLNRGIVITSGNRLDERCLRVFFLTSAFLVFFDVALLDGPARVQLGPWSPVLIITIGVVAQPADPTSQSPSRTSPRSTHLQPRIGSIHVWQVSTRRMTGRRQNSDSDVSVRGSLGGLRGSPSDCSAHWLAELPLRTRPPT